MKHKVRERIKKEENDSPEEKKVGQKDGFR